MKRELTDHTDGVSVNYVDLLHTTFDYMYCKDWTRLRLLSGLVSLCLN